MRAIDVEWAPLMQVVNGVYLTLATADMAQCVQKHQPVTSELHALSQYSDIMYAIVGWTDLSACLVVRWDESEARVRYKSYWLGIQETN